MDHSSLSNLIDALERGTNLHISIAFLDNFGNRKTRCTHSQAVHDRPVCMAAKKLPQGLVACYRCRSAVQKAMVKRQKPMAGLCSHGVYEYCRPVIYDGCVICVIFIGNILTDNPAQREKLSTWLDGELLQTMEQSFTPQDCIQTADILESYIVLLFDRYGVENKTFDPLVENIKNYIRESLSYDFTMEELAATFNYTPKYLGRLFKSRTGQTIKEYCNRSKVSRAKLLLTETTLSIESIAIQAGFSSVTYFDHVFRKTTGLSPQAFRHLLKKQPR